MAKKQILEEALKNAKLCPVCGARVPSGYSIHPYCHENREELEAAKATNENKPT